VAAKHLHLKRIFDVLCLARVTFDTTQDGTLAKILVDSHMLPHPEVSIMSNSRIKAVPRSPRNCL
jgi:hypothetical protein